MHCLVYLFLSFCLCLFGIFIWFCMDTLSQNRKQQISSYGLEFLIKTYLVKSFQKIIWCLSKTHSSPLSDSSFIETQQSEFVVLFTSSFTKKMLDFVRGPEISKLLLDHLYLSSFESISIFLLPDIFVNSTDYYHHLLEKTSSCLKINPPLSLSNEEAKQYLANLIQPSPHDSMEWTTISLEDT